MDDRAVATMSGSELLAAYDVLHDEIAERESRGHQILERMGEMGYAKEIGAHDTARLISTRYRLDAAEAHRRVKLATALPKYNAVSAALPTPGNDIADGEVVVHTAQAAAIVSALEQIPASAKVPVEDLIAAEEQLVQAARHLTPSELRSLGAAIRNILDTDGPEPRENAARHREEVWLKKADGGVRFSGYLAAENAEALETVLQAGAKPHKTDTGERDPRSRGKRQADALVDALNIALSSGDLPARGGIKPHIAVTINLEDLLNAGRQATGDLTYGDGLSAAAIRRLACDAGIIPIVLGSDSQILDVGREHRYVTDGLRNALNHRDRGCVVCGAPPIYCDAHHLIAWQDGGTTSLTNLVLLCRVHHTDLHNGHWTVTITNHQVNVTAPTWANRPPPDTRRRLAQPSTPAPATPAAPAAAPCATPTTPPPPPPAPTRNWPYNADIPWPAEHPPTSDPWPDNSASPATPPASADPATAPARASTTDPPWPAGNAVALDPWADSSPDPATPTPATADPATSRPRTIDLPRATHEDTATFDPWADSA